MWPNFEQKIESGDGNIQATGDVTIANNYFKDYYPKAIRFYENDISGVLFKFNDYIENLDHEPESQDSDEDEEFELIEKQEKNRLNKLSDEYFHIICEDYLPYFKKVEIFLSDPKNKKYLRMYMKTAFELKFRIAVLRKNHEYFEEVLSAILDNIIANEKSEITQNIDLFIVFMNYMYWHCDIGRRK